YMRECRRLRGLTTIREQQVSAEYQPGARAELFADSVGLGWYPIDIHRAGADDVGVSCRTRPFQIPLGALIPIRVRNLIAGAKNLATTHITNGCYRLHPVEWNTGEAAGTLAAFTLETGRDAAAVHRDAALLRAFQRRLVNRAAHFLVRRGLKQQEKFNVHLGNCPEFLVFWLAAARTGTVMVPTNPASTAEEMAYILAHSEARLAVTEARCGEACRAV